MPPNKHVTTHDLARTLSCSRRTLQRKCLDGTIPCIKVGRDWRIDPEKAILALSHTVPKRTAGN